MQDTNYTTHRLYGEFQQLRADDAIFSDLYPDTEHDFLEWAMQYEVDADWREAIGAKAVIQWKSDGGKEICYFSFGQWEDDAECDSYGVMDDFVFFYAHEGVKQMLDNNFEDWDVLEFDLVYDKEDV